MSYHAGIVWLHSLVLIAWAYCILLFLFAKELASNVHNVHGCNKSPIKTMDYTMNGGFPNIHSAYMTLMLKYERHSVAINISRANVHD